MLCDNCGKKEANVHYSENINGRKKEFNLCEECSQKLGIDKRMEFSMPIDFSSFLGEFMEDFTTPEFMPLLNEVKTLKCDQCGCTFDDIVNTGRLGCGNCYEVFESRLEPIIRRIQGANYHVGRTGKEIDNKIDQKIANNKEQNQKSQSQDQQKQEVNEKTKQLEKLQEDLKQAIKEERYEDAAKIRDEIKKNSK